MSDRGQSVDGVSNQPAGPGRRLRARGRRHTPGQMNQLETAWSHELEAWKRAGTIAWYGYEPFTLTLAHRTRFTPDFAVIWADGELSFYEVKGHWEDDARVKIKVAARLYPFFRFQAVQKGKRGEPVWRLEEIAP